MLSAKEVAAQVIEYEKLLRQAHLQPPLIDNLVRDFSAGLVLPQKLDSLTIIQLPGESPDELAERVAGVILRRTNETKT